MPSFARAEAVFFDVDNTLYDFDASVQATLAHMKKAFPDVLGHLRVGDLEARYWAANGCVPFDVRRELIAEDPLLYRRATWVMFLEREAAGVALDAAWSAGDPARFRDPEDTNDLPGTLARTFADWRWANLRDAAYAGSRATIDRLLAEGRQVGIITNGPPALQRAKVRALGYEDLLPADMILVSGEFGADKPHPSIFREAQKRAGVAAEDIVYVGDSVECDVACKGVGFHFIFFDAKRGPRPDFKALCGHEPDAVAHDYVEVARLLGVGDA